MAMSSCSRELVLLYEPQYICLSPFISLQQHPVMESSLSGLKQLLLTYSYWANVKSGYVFQVMHYLSNLHSNASKCFCGI